MRNSNPILDIFFILLGLIFIGFYFHKDKINSLSDLVEINGTIRDYSFVNEYHFGYRGGGNNYLYYIYLNEYPNSFQIGADYVGLFDKTKFEQSEKPGDSLKLFISKHDYLKIGSNDKALAFGVYSKTQEFLSTEYGIQSHNSKSRLVFGLIFIIVGAILLYLDIKRRKKWRIREEELAKEYGLL